MPICNSSSHQNVTLSKSVYMQFADLCLFLVNAIYTIISTTCKIILLLYINLTFRRYFKAFLSSHLP